MKKIVLFAAGILLFFASCQESREKTFERLAKEYTAKCPVALGVGIRVDSMKYNIKTNTNSNYYTLSGNIDSPDSIQKNKAYMESSMIAAVRNSVDMKEYKDFNTTIEYVYFSDKNKKELFRIAVGPKLYK
ncbi:hypothetical protein [uncultured Bacteroides sp.]|uniref:hypothetical protein n=1 Tax=uncultured Bacteroides sp. TaxID=162156 RepID=UPI002AAB9BB0|nr:hypothetical protein [uncultured Bacteroides sp.]